MAVAGIMTYKTEIDRTGFDKGLAKIKSIGSSSMKVFAGGMATATTAITAGIGAFLALGEATQETREDMGKLETAFTTAGFTSETAKKSFEGMVGILGETDQSVEAVNHLAQLTDSEEELSKWTNIAAGVYATFGDSLPLEGLTEAANETAKVGQVTGPLADALNWAGVSEDEFNKKLASCNTEQERATLITQTLSDIYQEAGDTYSEVNKDLIEARQATANFNNTLADLGALSMPITTALKNAFSGAVQAIMPEMEQLSNGILGIFSGESGAQEQLVAGLNGLIDKLITGITELAPKIFTIGTSILQSILLGIQNNLPLIVTGALNLLMSFANFIMQNLPLIINTGIQLVTQLIQGIAQMLPQLIPMAINCILTIVDGLISNIDQIINAGIQLLLGLADGIINALPQLIEKIPQIITSLIQAIQNNLPKILQTGIELLIKLGAGLIAAIPQLLAMLPQIIGSIINAFTSTDWGSIGRQLLQGLLNGFSSAGNIIWDAIKRVGNSMIDGIKSFFGIHSPSRLFAELGRYLPQGFAVGIEADTDKALKSIDNMNDKIMADMTSAVATERGAISSNASVKSNNSMLNVLKAEFSIDGNINMEGRKVGRYTTPYITKTYKLGGAY